MSELAVVTGAFSYSGFHIARKLLDKGISVRTITGHPDRPNPFEEEVDAHPFNFDDPKRLTESLRGARVLYNTYWIRFPHGSSTYEKTVDNSSTLFECARKAGVERVIHISITNPAADSQFPYFRGKAEVERALVESGLSHAIVRPTVLFGGADVFINNIAWFLRHAPVFAIPGNGEFLMQPVHVGDQAELCIEASYTGVNLTFDAAGPEIFTFDQVVRLVKSTVRSHTILVKVPVVVALNLARVLSFITRDVVLTRDEMEGLIAGMIVSQDPSKGRTRFSEWLNENSESLGRSYASELARHYRSGPSLPFNATQ